MKEPLFGFIRVTSQIWTCLYAFPESGNQGRSMTKAIQISSKEASKATVNPDKPDLQV